MTGHSIAPGDCLLVAAQSRTANQRQQAFFFPATDFLGTGAN
jgi:hypothetical protein